MKHLREELWFNTPNRRDYLNITHQVEALVKKSGVQQGLCLVNAMHITASVYINDNEPGLIQDYDDWLEKLAPFDASPTRYRHNRTGEDNADAHMKRQIMGREIVVAITDGKLDFGPWEQIFYAEFDGRRRKRVLVKIIGEQPVRLARMLPFSSSNRPLSSKRIWLARSIAATADVVQLAVFPYFAEGIVSPFDAALDVAMAVALTVLVGWHITFLPAFLAEAVPVADLAPTWTLAAFIATRGRGKLEASAELPPPLAGDQPWRAWYDGLAKPWWTPSPRVISLIWAVLYPIILASDGFVLVQAVRGKLPWVVVTPFGVNLAANLLFTPVLFRLRNLRLAALVVLIVAGTIPWMMWAVWPHYWLVAIAQLPYLLWASIAAFLQLSISARNRH